MTNIDHLILNVNDIPESVDFYINVLGFKLEGEDAPFTIIRVSEDFTLQLAPWGTKGNEHYAFSMSRADFERTFALIIFHLATHFTRSEITRVPVMKAEPKA